MRSPGLRPRTQLGLHRPATGSSRTPVTSKQWWRIHQPALGPQPVQAALDLERARGAEVAVVHLAVIAHALEYTHAPAGHDAEHFIQVIADFDRALYAGVFA